MGTLCVYWIWLPFFFMLTMLFCSLDKRQAYKHYEQTTWMYLKAILLFISTSLEVKLYEIEIMIIAHDKRKLIQEAVYLDKCQNEIIHKYQYLEIYIYSHGYFEPSNKKAKNNMYKSLDGRYKERCSSQSRMLATQIPSIQGYGALNFYTWYWKLGRRLETLLGRFFEKSMKIYMMSHVKVRSSTTYYILLAIFS